MCCQIGTPHPSDSTAGSNQKPLRRRSGVSRWSDGAQTTSTRGAPSAQASSSSVRTLPFVASRSSDLTVSKASPLVSAKLVSVSLASVAISAKLGMRKVSPSAPARRINVFVRPPWLYLSQAYTAETLMPARRARSLGFIPARSLAARS
jgi:hypothetical protein